MSVVSVRNLALLPAFYLRFLYASPKSRSFSFRLWKSLSDNQERSLEVERKMKPFSSFWNGLARSLSSSWKEKLFQGREEGREAADELRREAKKKDLILWSSPSGSVRGKGLKTMVSAYSKRGEKGVNQDCSIVWEEFGCQEDMTFCGVFDGHGPWGHYVSRRVCKSLPPSLLCDWQEALSALADEKKVSHSNLWKLSYLRSCATVDQELEHTTSMDCFYSGTTALTMIKQGDLMVIANVGDSRAVLATTSGDGNLVPIQLTVDFKPNLPQEAERITRCKGRVFCAEDEPGVHRVWLPDEESPGLAMSRSFGDYCIKDFGLISVPEVTHWNISTRDQFIILATDGVWDVISNKEAVDTVSLAEDRRKSAKNLVECAVRSWKQKRRGIAVDDCSAICLFFHSSQHSVYTESNTHQKQFKA